MCWYVHDYGTAERSVAGGVQTYAGAGTNLHIDRPRTFEQQRHLRDRRWYSPQLTAGQHSQTLRSVALMLVVRVQPPRTKKNYNFHSCGLRLCSWVDKRVLVAFSCGSPIHRSLSIAGIMNAAGLRFVHAFSPYKRDACPQACSSCCSPSCWCWCAPFQVTVLKNASA